MNAFRKIATRSLLLTLALTGLTSLTRAADPAPVPFVRASVASINAVTQLASDYDLTLPGNIQSIIETQFPFIGPGGIDPAKPIGAIILAGENLSSAGMALYALPIAPGKVSIDDLKNNNAIPVEGETDTVSLEGSVILKRSNDYLFMYIGAAAVIKDIKNSLFASDYQSPGTLAFIEINGAAARTAAPKLTENFFNTLKTTGNPESNPLSERTRLATQEFLANALAKIDLLTLSLSGDKTSLKLAATVTPTFTTGSRSFPKPILPSAALFTANLVYPDAAAANWLPNLLSVLKDDELPIPGAKLTPEQITQERASLTDLLKLLAAPDAQSFSAENHSGKIVIVIVNQYDHDVNVPAQFRKDCEDMEVLNKAAGNTDAPIVFQDISPSDGSTGLRIDNPTPGDSAPTAFFLTQKGRTATFTISFEANAVPTLVDLSPSDKISDLLSARVDLTACLAAAQNEDTWKSMPPALQDKLTTLLTGKAVEFTASTDPSTNSLHLILTVPGDVIRAGQAAFAGMRGN